MPHNSAPGPRATRFLASAAEAFASASAAGAAGAGGWFARGPPGAAAAPGGGSKLYLDVGALAPDERPAAIAAAAAAIERLATDGGAAVAIGNTNSTALRKISIVGLGGLPDWLLRRGFGEWLLAEAGVRAAVVAEFRPTQQLPGDGGGGDGGRGGGGAATRSVRLADRLVVWARLPPGAGGAAAVPQSVVVEGCSSLRFYID